MSDRYTAWLQYIAERDVGLTNAAVMALCLVASYVFIVSFPRALQGQARTLYLTCGLPLFVMLVYLGLSGTVLSPEQAMPLIFIAAFVGVSAWGLYGIVSWVSKRRA